MIIQADVYLLHQIKVNADEIHKLLRMIYPQQDLIMRKEVEDEINQNCDDAIRDLNIFNSLLPLNMKSKENQKRAVLTPG